MKDTPSQHIKIIKVSDLIFMYNLFIRIISAPGMWIQRMTTKEPDDSMIEVAIVAVEAVFDWKSYHALNKSKKTTFVNLKEESESEL